MSAAGAPPQDDGAARGWRLNPRSRRAKAAAAHWAAVRRHARALFEALGYENATMRQIAAAAGCSTGLLFSRARDKADLWRRVMDRPAPDVRAYLEGLAAVEHPSELATSMANLEARRMITDLWGRT